MSPLVKRFTNLQAALIALFFVTAGMALIVASDDLDYFKAHHSQQLIAREMGALMFVTASVSILWELFAKRSLLQEVIELVRLSDNVLKAGLRRAFTAFYADIDWADLFKGVTEVDLAVSYARTWRNTHRTELRALKKKAGARVRLILPDPEYAPLVGELARRYGQTEDAMKSALKEAIAEFTEYLSGGDAELELYLAKRQTSYSYFRFNDTVVVAIICNADGRADRNGLVCNRPGKLTESFEADFECFRGQARRILPPPAE